MKNNIQKVLLFFLVIISSFSLTAQDFTNPKHQLKGKILKLYESKKNVFLRQDTWRFKKEDFQGGTITVFDEKGNYKSSALYIFPSEPYLTAKYKTNSKGNLTSTEVFGSKISAFNVTYHENNNGLIDSIVHLNTNNNKIFRTNTYQYKKRKLVTTKHEEINRDTFNVEHKTVKGKITEEVYYNKSENTTSIRKHEYNKNGDLKLTNIYNEEKKLINQQIFIYQYDKKENWTKRLSTDLKLDERILTERDIVYKGASTQNISKKDLVGYWTDWSGTFKMEVKKTQAKIINKGGFRASTTEGEYSYSSSTGIFTIVGTSWRKEEKDFHTSFNGSILTLEAHDGGKLHHLRKIELAELSHSERNDYNFKASMEKPTAKSFKENGKYGLKSKSGKVLFAPKYESVYALSTALVKVSNNGKYGLANYQGQLITECKYDGISTRNLGYLRVEKDRKRGLIDIKGKEIVPPKYDNIWVSTAGVILFEDQNKKGILSLDNKIIAEPKYNSFGKGLFNRIFAYSGGYQNHDWYDGRYQLVKKLDMVNSVEAIDVNCFKFRGQFGWGLMDSLGNEIMASEFDELQRGSAQLLIAKVKKAKKYGLVNTAGEKITNIKYDRILTHYADDYAHDLGFELKENGAAALFFKNNEFGYLDGLGNEIAPSLSKSINRKYSFKNYDNENGYKFLYPYFWELNGHHVFHKKEDRVQAGIRFKEINYNGDLRQWILQNSEGSPDLKTEVINGITTFQHFRKTDMRTQIQFEQVVYYQISDTKMIRFTGYCPEYHYLRFAQKFYDVFHSFELKK